MDACMATLFLVWYHGSCHGADRTPLTISTGVTGRLSLQVNGAHGTPVLLELVLQVAYHFM